MTLHEVIRIVISLVENASACPVVMGMNASFMTLAFSRIVRGANKVK